MQQSVFLANFANNFHFDRFLHIKLIMNNFRLINNLSGWLIFLVAASLYLLTAEPTASLWDCGEYISTAAKLQVGHPPGAPLFQLIGRLFALAAPTAGHVAYLINSMSAIASGFTILFLFWSITMLALKLTGQPENNLSPLQHVTIILSGIIGSLSYAFSDSFWFSAVEGEVYALSSFFTAVVFWAILKWERRADKPHADRWLLLIAYLMGLSIGVHLLNLLAIPAITLIYFYKKHQNIHWQKTAIALLVSFLLLASIMYLIVPEVVGLFALAELLFVNSLSLPFHTGTLFFAALLLVFIVAGIAYTHQRSKRLLIVFAAAGLLLTTLYLIESQSAGSFVIRTLVASAIIFLIYYYRQSFAALNTALLAFTFILIGYSSFMMLVIRANAGTPINENSPKDAISLRSYLNREQYGDWPLLYGHYYNSSPTGYDAGRPVYKRDDIAGRYVITDKNLFASAKYSSSDCTIFPRMYENNQPDHADEYKKWAGINDPENKRKPTFSENLKFFFNYQINHMYFRYFMWNFSGRQNDIQGYSDRADGNWISGIGLIDRARVGDLTTLPASMHNKAQNKYYMLPLILGLIGLVFHFRRSSRDGFVVMSLFIMTGLAIVVYLNQYSPQPRERDYAYAASFYAFAIWIGLGLMGLTELLRKKLNAGTALVFSVLISAAVPALLLAENYDDHNRSGRYTALELSKAYLDSCEPNAILFTVGDNDTFPLWYAQEVENYRTDIRVCNLSLLGMDWYIDQMKTRVYDSDPVPFNLQHHQYRNGTRDIVYLVEQQGLSGIDLQELFQVLSSNESLLQQTDDEGNVNYFFPARVFGLQVDSSVVERMGIKSSKPGIVAEKQLVWKINQSAIQKNDLLVLDLLAHFNWERPIYITSPTASPVFAGLSDFFRIEGLAYRLIPYRDTLSDNQVGSVHSEILYRRLMKQFKVNFNNPDQYYNEDYIRYGTNLRNIYARLANQLMAEGKPQLALEVCDTALQRFPAAIIPSDYFSVGLAEVYYKARAYEKGDQLIGPMLTDLNDRITWYTAQPSRVQEDNDMNIRQSLALLNYINQVVQREGRTELAARSAVDLQRHYEDYVRRNPNLR